MNFAQLIDISTTSINSLRLALKSETPAYVNAVDETAQCALQVLHDAADELNLFRRRACKLCSLGFRFVDDGVNHVDHPTDIPSTRCTAHPQYLFEQLERARSIVKYLAGHAQIPAHQTCTDVDSAGNTYSYAPDPKAVAMFGEDGLMFAMHTDYGGHFYIRPEEALKAICPSPK